MILGLFLSLSVFNTVFADPIIINTENIDKNAVTEETVVSIIGDDGNVVATTKEESTVTDTTKKEPTYIDLGKFTITHYCCEKRKHICGTGTGLTYLETEVRPGVIAVDPDVIPLGSKVMINGEIYSAEDTGGSIKGNKIDIAVNTHKEALNLGKYKAEAYLVVE